MKENGERCGVSCENDNLGGAPVEGFGCCEREVSRWSGDSRVDQICARSTLGCQELTFVCAFLQLTVVGGLLDDSEDLLRESLVGNWPGCGWVVGHVGGLVIQGFFVRVIERTLRVADFSRDPCVGSPLCELFVVGDKVCRRSLSQSWRKSAGTTQELPSPEDGANGSSL